MRKIRYLACLLLLSLNAHADEPALQLKPDDGERFVRACNAPEITAELTEVRSAKGDGWVQRDIELEQKGACIGYPGGRIRVLSETNVETANGSYDAAEIQPINDPEKHLYVLKRNIIPVTAEEMREAKERACGTGPNGEVDRWIVEPDGTPKLKRFMITSKCVNGKLMQYTKRLN